MKTKTIKVDYLARVEGEGALYIKLRGGQVVDVKLKIFEPPRFFEAFLRGRKFSGTCLAGPPLMAQGLTSSHTDKPDGKQQVTMVCHHEILGKNGVQ